MPRTGGIKPYFTFIRGLVTEASPLTFPEGASLDEENFDLNRDGSRQRRLGVDYESNYVKSAPFASMKVRDGIVTTHNWNSVAEDGDREFLVIQIAETLYFHDLSGSNDGTSVNKKAFTVNLNNFLVDVSNDAGLEPIDGASGRGYFFVSNKYIEPFYITYDPATDTISTSAITVKIRDLSGLDDGLDVDERPASLSDEHKYNLYNQNWSQTDIDAYEAVGDMLYPSNSQIWFLAKDTNDEFDPEKLDDQGFGTTQAPKGKFILNAFEDNKSDVSGIPGLTENPIDTRPRSIEFFAGRVFYALKDKVYFSQLVLDDINIGRCYQEADPTSEHIFDLVDTDGGVIPIPDAGDIVKLLATSDYILAFSSNGVWVIRGIDGRFTATDQQVNVVTSDVGIDSVRNTINVEGNPIFLTQAGIYTIQAADTVTGTLAATNITETIIHTEYTSITRDAIINSSLAFDPISRKVYMFYNGDENYNGLEYRNRYDTALILDLPLNAFYKYTLSSLSSNSPYIYGAYILPQINNINQVGFVQVGLDQVQVNGEDVYIEEVIQQRRPTSLQLLALESGTTNISYTFAEFNNDSFVDWEMEDGVGVDFTSFLLTGYMLEGDAMRKKQATYIDCFFLRTETGFVDDGFGGAVFDKPSGCLLEGFWDWASSSISNRVTQAQQVYRFRRNFLLASIGAEYDDGFPVVFTQNKLRGKGRSLHLKFTSEPGKDMKLLGWSISLTAETQP